MPASNLGAAKRAFVKVLLSLAVSYAVTIEVNRDSADSDVLRAYKRLVLKVHPDKGGRRKDFQKLRSTCKEVAEKLDGAAASN